MLVKKLEVELSLRRRIRVVGVKRNLTESRRCKEEESENQEYEFECVGEHEHALEVNLASEK
jgi:hypothetical protein